MSGPNNGILYQRRAVWRQSLRISPLQTGLGFWHSIPDARGTAMPTDPERLKLLSALARKVLWLSSWTIHHANHIRPNTDGLKVGGHQASSASLATIMSALYFSVLRPEDRVAVKPHASPVF